MAKISKEEYELLKSLCDSYKWIARDLDGDLFAYSEGPSKVYVRELRSIDNHLFKFIQWEDEETYSIAELIEEYESEETEVKKDIEWLNNEVEKRIKKIRTDEVSFAGSDFFDEGYMNGMKDVQAIANRLDEPEVLSPDWVDKHKYRYDNVELVGVKDLQNLLVPKQELPVIPKFVAEWIEVNKQVEEKWNDYSNEDAMNDTIHFTIYGLFADYPSTNSHVELRKPVLKWLSFDRGNYFKLINAVRYDYEVAEEQKYYVLDKEDATLLKKSAAGEGVAKSVGTNIYNVKSWKDDEKYQLTEQEIKDYDPRYWPFRKPVEEVEENDEN